MRESQDYQLPPELQRWGWTMQQMKSGPRKHPGGWWQFIFWRLHGLAAGDADLDPGDPSLRVKVRRATLEEALDAAIEEMRTVSSLLAPGDDYDERIDEFSRHNPGYLWRVVAGG